MLVRVDLSNYDIATIRMKATGADSSGLCILYANRKWIQYQAVNWVHCLLMFDHDVVVPLAGITTGISWTRAHQPGGHASDLVIDIDSVIYSVNPRPLHPGGKALHYHQQPTVSRRVQILTSSGT